MSNYPEDIGPAGLCVMEGCIGNGNCRRCGTVNYQMLGYFGAVASAAKRWGVSQQEAEDRIAANQEARDRKQHPEWFEDERSGSGPVCPTCQGTEVDAVQHGESVEFYGPCPDCHPVISDSVESQ